MCERHGDGTERDDGGDVANDMADGDGDESFKGGFRDGGWLAEFQKPEWNDVDDADEELEPRDEPGEREPVENLFVGDVVDDIECIPEGDVKGDLEC